MRIVEQLQERLDSAAVKVERSVDQDLTGPNREPYLLFVDVIDRVLEVGGQHAGGR